MPLHVHNRPRRRTLIGALCALALVLAYPAGASASVTGQLAKLQQQSRITPEQALAARKSYLEARSLRRRLDGARRTVFNNQLRQLESMARRGKITGGRVTPMFTQLAVNSAWFRNNQPAADGTRRRFSGSRIYYQYFRGWGWQFHPLANFARLNAVWSSKSAAARRALGSYANELISFGSIRGGALTWEYYFPFMRSAPPWISSISQGTAIQSLARSGEALADPAITAAATRGARAFDVKAPTGLKVERGGGLHFLGYSGNRRSYIYNMFAQSLNGLHDYARITQDAAAKELLAQGMIAARLELPTSDTGAWSLYEVKGAESNLNYHRELITFYAKLCEDMPAEQWLCALSTRLSGYLAEAPVVRGLSKRIRRGRIYLTFNLSKVSTVTVTTPGGGTSRATVGRGKRVFSVKKARSKAATLTAVDLAGNRTVRTKK